MSAFVTMNPPSEQRRGFTLIEILVALAILAGTLVVLTEGYVNALNALSPPNDQPDPEAELAFVRERVLRLPSRDHVEAGGVLQTLTSGTVRWEAELFETEIIDVHRVVLSCEFEESRERHVRQFYVLRPHWSDPLERGRLLDDKRRALESQRARLDWTR